SAPPRCSTSGRSAVSVLRPGTTPRRSGRRWTPSRPRPRPCSTTSRSGRARPPPAPAKASSRPRAGEGRGPAKAAGRRRPRAGEGRAPGSRLGPGQVDGGPGVPAAHRGAHPLADDRRQVVVRACGLDEPVLVELLFLKLDGRVLGQGAAVE